MNRGGNGDSGRTVRESGVTAPGESAGASAGAATVRETTRALRESGATVRESAPTRRESGATVREAPDPSASAAPAREPQAAGWLPNVLANDYRAIESLPARGAEADLYVVAARGDDTARRVAKVYRQGVKPKRDVLERVRAADPPHVVRIESHGQEAGRWWELMEYAEHGSLRKLIEREGPRFPESLVAEILRQMNEALAGLHELPLEHRDLKPANVLVRSRDPLDLALTDFGISSVMRASVHLTDTARTLRYAPPEAIGSVVSDEAAPRSRVVIERTAWDYWSLGMMLVEMLRGAHPYDGLSEAVIVHQLSTQDVDELTGDIGDPRWRKLCRGLLRRTPAARWGEDAVTGWLADPDDPGLDVAEEAPAAGPGADLPPDALISFDGQGYSTPEDLGAALAMDWAGASSFWRRRFADVRTWVTDGLGLPELGAALAAIDDSDISLDAQVFSFVHHLAPNAPVRFRDEDISLSAEGLPALARRAVLEEDARARETLLALHRHGILALAGSLPEREALADVSRRWNDAARDYERLRRKIGARGVAAPRADDAELAALLAASLPDSPVAEPLRGRAREAATADALCCDWYGGLGSPDDMSAAALAMLPRLQAPAEREGRRVRGRPRRGFIGGAIVGGLFGLLGLSGWVLPQLAAEGRVAIAATAATAAILYAFIVVRFWYRENTAQGAWGSFLRGLVGLYRQLDIPPDGPWRWPSICFAIWALVAYLSILGAVVWGLATASAMPVFLTLNSLFGDGGSADFFIELAVPAIFNPDFPVPAGTRSTFVYLSSLYLLACSLLGGFVGLQARLLPAAPFLWLRNAIAARRWILWVFLAPAGLLLIPFLAVLLGLAALLLLILGLFGRRS